MKPIRAKLSNGLRLITIPMKDNPTVTVLVLVETGSKYETKEKNGISHFLEHMCFKGTTRRPSALSITEELDTLGSQYNAFTAQEYTGYYAKSAARHFPKIFDIVSDIYQHSTFPESEIQKEKGVIIEEINLYQDTPSRHVGDLLTELLYGDQPAGWSVLGTPETVGSMTQDDFLRYHRAHYVLEATTVVVAGAVTPETVKREAIRAFGAVGKSPKAGKFSTKERQDKPRLKISFKATDQTHLLFGFRAYDYYDKRNPAVAVLAGILGGGMSSRLFHILRDELGVAYYVRAASDAYTDHGTLDIAAGVTNGRMIEVIETILKESKRLITEPVSPFELKKVKEHLVGTMELELESSDAWAQFYGVQEILRKRLETNRSYERKIRAVTAVDVQKIAADLFRNETLNLALIGPWKDETELVSILHF